MCFEELCRLDQFCFLHSTGESPLGHLLLIDSASAFGSLRGSGDKSFALSGSSGQEDECKSGGLTELGMGRASLRSCHTDGKIWPGECRNSVEAEGQGVGLVHRSLSVAGTVVDKTHQESRGQVGCSEAVERVVRGRRRLDLSGRDNGRC